MLNLIGDINILDTLVLFVVGAYVWKQQRKQRQAEARKSLTRKLTIKERLNHKRNKSVLTINKSK